MATGTHGDRDEISKAEFDEAIDKLLGSTAGRRQILTKAMQLGLLNDHDLGKLAYLFFTDPDFARALSDKIWAARPYRGVAP